MMISFARHRFPPAIIRHAVWLYVRFTLSYRDVEDLLAERGLDVSYETVRRWVLKFGQLFARELRRQRPRPTSTWHLDEMAVVIAGRQFWLWCAIDDEGEVLDLLVQRRRDKATAVRLMRKLLKKQGFAPDVLVTDKLRSYRAARSEIGLSARHEQGLRKNNRAENSHQPTRRRERKMQRFKSPGSAQRFLSVHATVQNTFNVQRHLTSRRALRVFRDEAFRMWRPPSRPEPELRLPIFTRPILVRVTAPPAAKPTGPRIACHQRWCQD
jgi:putative transposase